MELTGALFLDKSVGITSHDLVNKVRKVLRMKRVGHTGTLDPFATGLMILCLGRATRLANYLSSDVKEYIALAKLGVATDTHDFTGRPISEPVSAADINLERLKEVLQRFRGAQMQVPPMYSAKKVAGEPLYNLARRGIEVERRAARIEVSELELLDFDKRGTFSFRVVCSAGTYVRTLAHDIGKALGCGAHLLELRRTRVGSFTLQEAYTLEALIEAVNAGQNVLVPPLRLLKGFAVRVADRQELQDVRNGQCLSMGELNGVELGQKVAIVDSSGQLFNVAEVVEKVDGTWLQPRVLIADGY